MERNKSVRNSNIELLRIIAMVLIIGHHYRVWSTSGGVDFSPNSFAGLFFNMGGKYGVDLFVIISSYYLADSRFKVNRIVRTSLQTWFYSIVFLILAIITHSQLLSGKMILMSVLPITYKGYWFVTSYIGLLALSPFLNKLFCNLDKKDHFRLCFVLVGMYFAMPSIFIKSNTYFSHLGMFITIYTVVCYLKKYGMPIKQTRKYLQGALIIYALIFLVSSIFVVIGAIDTSHTELWNYCKVMGFSEYSIFLLLSAIFLFYAFVLMPAYSNKIIDQVGKATFGIYLIHDNWCLREILWGNLLHAKDFLYSNIYIIYSVFAIIAVFLISLFVDLLLEDSMKIFKMNLLIEKISKALEKE